MIPLHDDNPTTLKPIVTLSLIIICLAIFLWQISLSDLVFQHMLYSLGMVPATLVGDKHLPAELDLIWPVLTPLTSMFLHADGLHLLGNLLYLWIFGNNVEEAMGHFRFLLFYLLCGIAAVLAQALPAMESEVPMVGASGAISGVLGAYLLLYPKARILVIPVRRLPIPMRLAAIWVLGFWFVFQFIGLIIAEPAEAGVAWRAHIGGFVAGMVLIPIFKYRRVPLWAPAQKT